MSDPKNNVWPQYLMIRDTQLHDDMGGAGQRIYTTAGQGYEKRKYVLAESLPRCHVCQGLLEIVEQGRYKCPVCAFNATYDANARRRGQYEESARTSAGEHMCKCGHDVQAHTADSGWCTCGKCSGFTSVGPERG